MTFRLDRFLTLYFFYPLVKLFPRRKGLRIPILMYHSISDDPETGHPYYWINTSPARFEEHMRYLHDNGYTVISLSHAVNLLFGRGSAEESIQEKLTNSTNSTNGTNITCGCPKPTNSTNSTNETNTTGRSPQPIQQVDSASPSSTHPPIHSSPHYVVLTFDDGYRDFYTHAFPVLKKYGFTATVFLPTAYIDNNGKPGLKGKQHLTWDEVRELHAQGIDFGSHTVNHARLNECNPDELERELRDSRTAIGTETNTQTDLFCYPYKFPEADRGFGARMNAALGHCGYVCGVSTRLGIADSSDNIVCLKRIPCNDSDNVSLLKAKLEGGYNWLYLPQYGLKCLRQATN